MKLYYHKDLGGNFGDDMNPWLWGQLLPRSFDGECFHNPELRSPGDADGSLFVGIGTLLNHRIPQNPVKAIFGSGAGYGADPRVDDSWHVYCARGPLTAKKLNVDVSLGITDPAMLASRVPLPNVNKSYSVAYMPHCSNAKSGYWQLVCEQVGIHFIDPRGSVDSVLKELLATDVLLTEAMHGAILADALRVPWVAITTAPDILSFKWQDWCYSLGLEYAPIQLPTLWPIIEKPSLVKRIIHSTKFQLAARGLSQAAKKATPILSRDQVLEAALDNLENKLDNFREDLAKGLFD